MLKINTEEDLTSLFVAPIDLNQEKMFTLYELSKEWSAAKLCWPRHHKSKIRSRDEMAHCNGACPHAYAACQSRSARWMGIGGSRRAQESGLSDSEDNHPRDRTHSSWIAESVRDHWKWDHERWKVEQVPQGIQVHSRLVLDEPTRAHWHFTNHGNFEQLKP